MEERCVLGFNKMGRYVFLIEGCNNKDSQKSGNIRLLNLKQPCSGKKSVYGCDEDGTKLFELSKGSSLCSWFAGQRVVSNDQLMMLTGKFS